jgi:putative hemolysin
MDVFLAHPWKLLGMLALLAASAFFSSAETALFALRHRKLAEFRGSRSPLRRMAGSLMRDPGATVITILFGNMTVNVLFYALSTSFFWHVAPAVAGAVALATLLAVVIFGEVVPKSIAFAHAETWAPITAPVIFFLHKLLAPVRIVLNSGLIKPVTRLMLGGRDQERGYATEAELHALVADTARRGAISDEERVLLHEVIQLGRLIVRDVMVPRVDVIVADADQTREQFLSLCRRHRLTKLPLCEGDLDHVLGKVHVRDVFLKPDAPLRELVRPVPFVPELMRVEALLEEFRRTRTQFAVAVDEYGGAAGIVTLEDIVEELVGQIGRQRGADRELAVLGEDLWRAPGSLPMHDWAEHFHSDPSEGRFATLGGYVTALIGRPAAVGDRVEAAGFAFTVEQVSRRRIVALQVRRLPRPAGPQREGGGR